jgi:hypothetical protein
VGCWQAPRGRPDQTLASTRWSTRAGRPAGLSRQPSLKAVPSRRRQRLLVSMHLSSRDRGRPAAGRAIAIACKQEPARGPDPVPLSGKGTVPLTGANGRTLRIVMPALAARRVGGWWRVQPTSELRASPILRQHRGRRVSRLSRRIPRAGAARSAGWRTPHRSRAPGCGWPRAATSRTRAGQSGADGGERARDAPPAYR